MPNRWSVFNSPEIFIIIDAKSIHSMPYQERAECNGFTKYYGTNQRPSCSTSDVWSRTSCTPCQAVLVSNRTRINWTMGEFAHVCAVHRKQDKSNPTNYHLTVLSQSSAKSWKVSLTVLARQWPAHWCSIWMLPGLLNSRLRRSVGSNIDWQTKFQR